MLQRMRELAVQAGNGTYSTTQRSYLNTEFSALTTQIGSIASQTTWNGTALISGATTSFSFQVGQNSGQTIAVTVSAMTTANLGVSALTVNTAASASSTLVLIDSALDKINNQRAVIGAGVNRLTYAADNITNVSANVTASRSSIMDTDYALASTQLSKTQIIQQASTAMLAQANQQPQSVLALLK